MLGVESKPNDTDRFKTDSHESALDKLGYRNLFGTGLGAGLAPALGTGLGANLSASISASLNNTLATNLSLNERNSGRDGLISSTNLSLDRSDRISNNGLGSGGGGSLGGVGAAGGNGGTGANVGTNGSNCKESGVELVKPSLVYDIASLILYRCQALPIRLKIALDRLFSVLMHEDVLQVLHGFGWTYEDYARGYMLQDRNGTVLHKWNMVTSEEEAILLQQFLRFGETKNIVQQLLNQQDSAVARLDRVARDIREARDLRDSRESRESREMRDIRHYRDRSTRDYPEHREHRDHRDHREFRENRDLREFRDDVRRDDMNKGFPHLSQHHKQLSNHHHQQNSQQHNPQQLPLHPPFTDPSKPLDPEQLKKLLERNMLFSPFMRAPSDPAALLRQPHHAAPPALPPTSPLSNLLAVNPSLASSLLANPQLASSLSMLRLPVPPVSLPNLSPSNGTLPASFGGPTSPMGGSPLNRLQSMQPFDFRKERKSPSPAPRPPVTDLPVSLCGPRPSSAAATSPNSVASAGSIGGTSPSSTGTSLAASGQPNPDPGFLQEKMDHLSEDDDSSSTSSVALNLSTTTTTTSPAATPVGVGPGPGCMPIPSKPTTPTGPGPQTPPKRSWNPINMGTSLINPVTGKKRVQCNVCLKTFCDKGALKIHFSAVHLREMHKCTVEGCNMMFSSRRSRNRHSANPNPKLHTPHVRRKISPHDGRTSAAHSVMLPHTFQQQLQPHAGFPPIGAFPGQFGGMNPLTGLPFIPHSAATSADLHKQALEIQRQNLEMHAMGKSPLDINNRGNDELGWRYGPNSISTTTSLPDDGNNIEGNGNSDDKKCKFTDPGVTYNIDDEDSMSVDTHSLRGDGVVASPSANKRKRKSQNPTKFAFRLEDDDLISMDDDEDDDDDDLDDIDAKDSEDDKNEDKELDAMSDDDEEDETNLRLKHNENETKEANDASKEPEQNKTVVTSSCYDEPSEMSNALRHLEDLSKGNFNHMTSGAPPSQMPLNFHLSSTPGNGVTSSSPKNSDRDSDRDSDNDSRNEELENSLHYSEGGFLSNVDIPVDRENPRRCVACGKVFQNHFGVKIHYQNVHLKLMHKCSVEGCNAAFPSKRSRDRHASNLNLHRKLLSTSSENPLLGCFSGMGFPGLPFNPPLNPELLARLYSDPASFSLESLKAQLPTSLADTIFNADKNNVTTSGNIPTSSATSSPFFLHNLLPHLTSNNSSKPGDRSRTPSPQSSTPTPSSQSYMPITTSSSLPVAPLNLQNTSQSMDTSGDDRFESEPTLEKPQGNHDIDMPEEHGWVYNLEDDLPTPDRDGNMPCRFCYQAFEDGEGLKKHYETSHRRDMFKCSVEGCDKVFSSRRKRNSHELNFHNSDKTIDT